MVFQTKSAVIISFLCFIGMISCSKESAISTVSLENVAVLPSIHGENISSLISDSGTVRYRLHAKVWDVYSGATEPYWFFPEGAYLEQYDSLFQVILTVEADTAYFFEKKELWQLIGNVHIENTDGYKFDTSELFWNQKAPPNSLEAVYVDTSKIVRIDKNDGYGIIVSHGMKANQTITEYRFYNNSMELTVDEDAPAQPGDSVPKTAIER